VISVWTIAPKFGLNYPKFKVSTPLDFLMTAQRQLDSSMHLFAFTGGIHMIRKLFQGAAIVLFCNFSFPIFANAVIAADVHHFIYVGQDPEQLKNPDFLNTKQFEGAQVAYTWKHLENCKVEEDCEYDFKEIEDNLVTLQNSDKQLFIYLKDTGSTPEKTVPEYLLKDPKYGGGVAVQHDEKGRGTGVVARRWDREVQTRFHALIAALGKQFDGRVAGIRLGETAIDIKTKGKDVPKGYSPQGYVEAIKRNMLAIKHAFPNSRLVYQSANFMPAETPDHSLLEQIYQYGIEIEVGLGESDLMLDMDALKKNEIKGNKHHYAYQIMQKDGIKGQALIAVTAEDGNYLGKTGDDEKPTEPWQDIVPSMFYFAKNNLNAQYIFWQTQDPFFAHDVAPYVRDPLLWRVY
jgi:hypothetical protein